MNKLTAIAFLISFGYGGFGQTTAATDKETSNKYYRRAFVLAETKPDSAVYYYEHYRNAISVKDSLTRKRDIAFYNFVGAGFLSGSDASDRPEVMMKAIGFLNKVIAIDSLNLTANANLVAAYFNYGIKQLRYADYCKQRNLIEQADYTKALPSLDKLLECVSPSEYEKYNIPSFFTPALPYAWRVYRQDPENLSALEALSGIYKLLDDKKRHKAFQQQLIAAKEKKRLNKQ